MTRIFIMAIIDICGLDFESTEYGTVAECIGVNTGYPLDGLGWAGSGR